ncbi:MAG: N-acetyltransferase [Bacteroidia bacterium]|nr:N-acetyltransferase [Bacteroidia bacterium]
MKIEFKYAKKEDLPRIVSTYNSTIPSRLVTADLEPVSIESKQAWFDAHSENKRPLWVVECDGNYAGWMSFNSFYGRPAYDGTVEVSIYLEEDFRNKGLGKICLQKALDESPHYQIHSILGFIFGHNEPSLKLFYKFGFEKWAHFPGVANMDGILRDLIILGKKV